MSSIRNMPAKLLVVVALGSCLIGCSLAEVGGGGQEDRQALSTEGAEARLLELHNAARAAQGLAPLSVYCDLVDDARAQAAAMRDAGHIYHNPELGSVTSGWTRLGENVGMGPSADVLQQAFMNSPAHRDNILGAFRYVGIGFVAGDDGTLWVAVVFMDGPAGLGQATCSNATARISGSTRYHTAAAISQATFAPGVPVAFVASGENFPDALAGGPVAGLQGGPLLLTATASLPGATAAELKRLRPQTIVVLGGPAVVSPQVEQALGGLTDGKVVRLAGSDRYATAAAISAYGFPQGAEVVYLATGVNFPDALAGGPVAALDGGPLLLVRWGSIPAVVRDELQRLSPKRVVLLGGLGVVGPTVASRAGSLTGAQVTRLAGSNRYATAVKISASFFQPGVAKVFVATGENFPDALAGAAAAAHAASPLLLVPQGALPQVVAQEIERLAPAEIVVLGGEGSISAAVQGQLAKLLP